MDTFNTSTFKSRWDNFWNAPISPEPLGLFRILIALFALIQLIVWYPDWMAFFGKDAWVQWEISRALDNPWSIHLEHVHSLFNALFNSTEEQVVKTYFWVYVLSATGLLLGLVTRFWAILTWLCHYILMGTIPSFVYGVDIFLHIALFYLVVMPVNKAYSLDLLLGRANADPSWGATLSIRVLQVHMCLVYFSAGYEKMLAVEWWNGNVMWRSLVQPDFRQYDLTWLAKVPWIPVILSWFTMVVETFYCIGMWIPKLRVLWLLGIIGLHIGIALFLGLYLFGTIMILLSVSAFGFDVYRDIKKFINEKKRDTAGGNIPEKLVHS